MTQINAYLSFNGDCYEAMLFYQSCLGGELEIQFIADSPMASDIPPEIKGSVMHASLNKPGLRLMGSDMTDIDELKKGNSVALLLHCTTEAEIRSCFKQLSFEGRIISPLSNEHAAELTGQVRDKYGFTWLLTWQQE